MERRHDLLVEADNGSEVVFVCLEEACSRKVVLNRRRGDYTVLERGDFFATHTGSVGPITVSAATDGLRD